MPERIKLTPHFDVLGDILETIRFRGTIFFRSRLAAPWGMSLETSKFPRFHIAIDGNFFIRPLISEAPIEIKEMGMVMLPQGDAHWIADQPDTKLIPSEEAGAACELGNPLFQDGSITNNLLCGLIRYDDQTTHPLINALPEVIHIPRIQKDSPVWNLITLIDSEIKSINSLNSSVVDRLSEALFLKLLQEFVQQNEEQVGFISALSDRRLHMALKLIHERMKENLTIIKIAEEVGMSRATLVRRFREEIGMPPIEYLTQWRLLKAHNMLKHSTLPIENIAEEVGFATKETLTKAFKRRYGHTPGSLRQVNKG